MHRANQVIPGMAGGQIANPLFLSRQEIHFHGQPDGERRMLALRLADCSTYSSSWSRRIRQSSKSSRGIGE